MDELSPNPILDAELLRAFVAFAAEKNFTHAARRVALSQPAFFDRIQRLTERVGAPLYTREGRTLRLTNVGVRVAAFARDELARAAAFTQGLQGQAQTTLTLAAGEGAWLYVLGAPVRAFLADPIARTTRLDVLTRGGPDAKDAVLSGEATAAVGVFDLLPRGLLAVDVLTAKTMAAVPRTHRLAKRRAITLNDLAGERLVVAPAGQRHRDVVGRALASVGAGDADSIEADGWPQMLAFVAAGLGVAVVNGICTVSDDVVLRPLPELGAVTYRLVHRAAAESTPGFTLLRALIVQHGRPRRRRRSTAA